MCRWGERDRVFYTHTCWACHLLHTRHTYSWDRQQGISCSRFVRRSSCTESLKDEQQTHLDIYLCFRGIQCPLGRKTNPVYKVQWSRVSNTYSLYLTPEWCWEKIVFFFYGKTWRLSMCRVRLLSSKTQIYFCHSGTVKTFKYKVLTLTKLNNTYNCSKINSKIRSSWSIPSQIWNV